MPGWREAGERENDPSGAAGERAAAAFLRRLPGWRILARNWRNPADRREEIDLVACEGPVLVFVEVKTRAPDARVRGYYAVDRRKRTILRRAVRAYLANLRQRPRTVRFDIVEVEFPPGEIRPRITHLANCLLFGQSWHP